MTNEREIASWNDLGDAVTSLTTQVQEANFDPQVVLGVARGGACLGSLMAHRLAVKAFVSLNVEFYRGTGLEDVRLPAPVLVGEDVDTADLAGKRVLVVDDIAETGETLRFVHDLIAPRAGELRTAAWYLKPESSVKPDFWVTETSLWVVAPWNPASPTIEDSNTRLLNEQMR